MVYLFYREQKRLKEKVLFKNSPSLSKNQFNAVLSRELLSIKFKLNELLDEMNPCFKKSDHRGDESCRKQFTRYWMAYRGYQDIVAFQHYKTPGGMDAGLIILLQRVETNKEKNDKVPYNYFDPFNDLESVNEETLIQLHAYGPLTYNHINELEVGDIIQAYVYDPEDFGFLEPHESKIRVLDIHEHDSLGRNITVEILETHWDDDMLNTTREPAIRTLKYVRL
ncbi:MAG: hypothetical protein H0U75_11095 [Legionella sp.]|nr:hypothetical protein [Legionella sp.]